MSDLVCTLTQGDHAIGVGALVNSLARSDFEGEVHVGHKGDPPGWAEGEKMVVRPGLTVCCQAVDPPIHLARWKPEFMKEVGQTEPEATLHWVDTDMVLVGRWAPLREWAACRLLVVQHASFHSHLHPHRLAWRQYALGLGLKIVRELGDYINSGYLGCPASARGVLGVWSTILRSLEQDGYDQKGFQNYPSEHPWKLMDQAALNVALECTASPLAVLDPAAMDFAPNGYLFSHAAGKGKPWNTDPLRKALKGYPPTKADEAWWNFASDPIQVLPPNVVKQRRRRLRVAQLISRLYRHPASSFYG